MVVDRPFFIVGCGRSGTTLLRLLLSTHSRIHIPPETWFILALVKQFPTGESLDLDAVRSVVRVITQSYRWPDMNMDAGKLLADAMALRSPKLADVINLVYAHLNFAKKPRIGDKTPPYIGIVPELLSLYPDAKFIHLIRDGRDVAISFLEAGFQSRGSHFYDGAAFEWTKAIRLGRDYRNSDYSDKIFDVHYEDLVEKPEATLTAICKFLDEPFEPSMIEKKFGAESVPERERHIHQKLDQPILKENISVWKNKLSAFECFAMEACIGNELSSVGYGLRFNARHWWPVLISFRVLLRASSRPLARISRYLRRNERFANVHF